MNAKEMREKRQRVWEQMKALNAKAKDENRSMSTEEASQWDQYDEELKRWDKSIEAEERTETEEREQAAHKPAPKKDFTASENLRNYLLTGEVRYNAEQEEQRTAVQTVTTTAGGYLIPQGFSNELTKAMLEYGGMMEASRLFTTAAGNPMIWPTVNDTSNAAYQIAINTDHTTSAAALAYSYKQLDAYQFTSGIIQVPIELLQDSFFDMEAHLREMLAERFWRGLNTAFTTGNGSGAPNGIATASTSSGISSVSATAITRDNIVDLIHSVDPMYRKMPGCVFMFKDSTLKALKKIVTDDGQPFYQVSPLVGEAPTIEGFKYVVNQDVAAIGASAKSIFFGDFKHYVIRQVMDMQFVRLNERFAELAQVGFVANGRWDGELIDAGTHPIKHIVHPAS